MNCSQVRKNIVDGTIDEPTRQHIESCDACRELAADGGRLARALAHDRPESGTAAGFEEILAITQSDDSKPVWRLRSMPTPQRNVIAIAVTLTAFGVMFVVSRRPDWNSYPALQMAAVLVTMFLATAAAVRLSMPPAYRPEPASRVQIGFLVALLAVPFLPAILVIDADGFHSGAAAAIVRCFGWGTLAAFPALLAIRALQRNRSWGLWPTVFAAIAAAIGANMALQVHCPVNEAVHVATGHAMLGAVYAGLAAAMARVLRR